VSYSKIDRRVDVKMISTDLLAERLDVARDEGLRIAMCHGVFDLLHPGHLRHLAHAKELADVLVVSITADRFVNKGPGRPAFTEALRAEALASVESVDFVMITPDATALPAISAIKPNFYVKGGDYVDEDADVTGNIRRERELVESFGGELVHTDEIVFSSSELINRFLPQHSDAASEWIARIRQQFSIDEVQAWLDRIAALRVVAVGETIIDVYTECEALGKASKDPVLCFSRGPSLSHAGGILAVAGHSAGLGASTTVITGINHRNHEDSELGLLRERGVDLRVVDIHPQPTVRKERLIDNRTGAPVLEIYDMDDSPLSLEEEKKLIREIRAAATNADVMIVADYGHGLISDVSIKALTDLPLFLAVNTQVNAGNRGFNSVSRYPRADFVTLNGLEASLEVRRRHVDLRSYVPDLQVKLGAAEILVTRGGAGLDFYSQDGSISHAPALAPFVKDRVGAGDAVLTITALLASVGAPPALIGFLGNLVGAWAVSFLGNEQSLDRATLSKAVLSTLK
jgi:rfaE bifunctional protein nucleotidyltransferase chain/domain